MKQLAKWLVPALVCASFSQPAAADDKSPQPVVVTNSNRGEFAVIYHRVTPAGIGAVAGGLIGTAIQVGVQSSEDSDMAKKVLASNPDLDCDRPLLAALKSKLQSSGAYTVDDSGAKGDEVIDIDIEDCGLHLADSNALQLSSYVNLTMKVKPVGGESWHEDIQVSGRNRYSFDDFVHQSGLASTEIADALKRAGLRVADKVIYKR